ncbi:MAG TPA: hypothetical protein VGK67_26020 [Myxococcales bacterium]|jgi:hypothetical protein
MAADDRFSRFRNIEKGRQEEASGKPAAASGRFGALEKQPDAASQPQAPRPVAPERFTPAASAAGPAMPRTLEEARRAAQAPSGLELAEVRPGDQPFVRCARCHIDSHALATTCSSCGTNLNTLEQQAFNERLWAEQRAALEKAAPPVVAPVSPAAPGIDVGLTPDQQRALAEALAREVAAKTRMEMGDVGAGGMLRGDELSFPLWFLNRVPPRLATRLVVGAIALSGALMAYKHTRALGFVTSLILGVTLWRLYEARS